MNELHERYASKGLVILGVPCNQFGHQVRRRTMLKKREFFQCFYSNIKVGLGQFTVKLYFLKCQVSCFRLALDWLTNPGNLYLITVAKS